MVLDGEGFDRDSQLKGRLAELLTAR